MILPYIAGLIGCISFLLSLDCIFGLLVIGASSKLHGCLLSVLVCLGDHNFHVST